ncbi:MAG: hypothetical protein AB1801_21120 [Chloroflexota bacterium]
MSLLLALLITVLVIAACGDAAPAVSPQQPAPAEESMKDKEAMTDKAIAGQEEMTDEAMPDDEAMTGQEEMSDEAMPDDEAMAENKAMTDETMAGQEEMSDEVMPDDEAMAENKAMTDETMAAGEAMELPAWFEAELTNVNTGETFTIADFQNKVVLIETMAVWCSNCLRQQREVQALHDLLGDRPHLVSVALDIDPNETHDTLKAHTDKNGFDWVYAVAPAEVARDIGQLYGGQFLNPPATPMLIIDRHSQAHPLPFGHKTAQALQEALALFLSEVEG